ncbi:P-loop containing nucleoside triphosphate hydrolase protein [Microdochium trichocladiopsis]|uniref:RNA helicase n=1 Tax=Microdochium trichocladiopsis TaxID=1682393 RepID=A0A9P8Y8G8_9PEZI|nr:P-loop containing nucleoside triphosphate hydrolase protein [Microdochium trichocladiopsis]KAH7032913.1 P-loop containing nucleoside triphosphate hydrolase protein [Microdochium trichocladiopsis]
MAKKFVPRQRKHKVLARQKAQHESTSTAEDGATLDPHAAAAAEKQPGDSNALEVLPEVQKAAQEARRAQLRQQLQGDAKISSKKAKRLEKYIDTKLKKDENRVLLAKLADQKIDTSLYASSRSLGQTKETKRQALSRALRERQAGIAGEGNDELLFETRDEAPSDLSEEEEQGDELQGTVTLKNNKPVVSQQTKAPGAEKATVEEPQADPSVATAPSLGSGLKRPLDLDDEGRPVLQKRQKRGGVKSKVSLRSQPTPPQSASESEEEEWGGFSSAEEEEDVDMSEHSGSDDASDAEAGSSAEGDTSSEEDDSSGEDDDEDEDEDEAPDTKQRSSAFKAWAHEQRNEALGYQPVENGAGVLDIPVPKDFKPRPIEQDPLPQELLPTQNTARKAYSVPVVRTPEIQAARLELPVVGEEQKLMEAIHNNNVVVVCGATGSGKTTQVPQFLFEAGYGSPNSPTPGLIGVTQPRKVAAVSMSKRVGQELGDRSDTVAYQIRFEGTTDDKTAIKFMTDGVLLREVASDISLIKYSAIIIDEAHERSVNTDILIGMLSRVVKLREEMAEENPKISPLKLIVMSATFRVDDVTKNPMLFQTPPPILNVEGRQHPVTVHFARQTKHDYVEEAFRKITRGHQKLPPGGFLVFLTGHDEIVRLSKKLKQASGGLNPVAYPKVRISATEAPLEVEDIDFGEVNDFTGADDDGVPFDSDAEDEDEDDGMFDIPDETSGGPLKMHILPLYSLLPTREQMRVFEEPPEGSRQIILATNVAETSLTIPGIRYVFDCGRAKERKYNRDNGVQSYEIGWISKASANQRSGRAGRTGPGHCYRLYSSAVYERDFAPFAEPELLRMPIEGVVLQLKAMRLQHVVNFPFPTPPDRHSIAKAEQLLQYLSAITDTGSVTQIGTTMSKFPLPPRFARILLIGHLHDCLPYTVALVAGLSVAEVFIPESQAIPAIAQTEDRLRTNEDIAAENRQSLARKKFNEVHRNFKSLDDASDAIKLLQVVGEFAHDPTEQWCEDHFVRFKSLQETQKLRKQITSLLQKDIPAFANLTYRDKLDRPSSKQITALKQMVAAGFIDQVAIRADLAPVPPEVHRKPKRAIDVPYLPLKPLEGSSRSDDIVDKAVFIHPSSCLAHQSLQELPDYIIYSNLQRAAPSPEMLKKPKTRMIALTDITGAQLAALAKGTPLIEYGKPIKEVKVEPGQTTRECWVVPYLRSESAGGGMGWPLPARKVRQKKVPGKGWVVE